MASSSEPAQGARKRYSGAPGQAFLDFYQDVHYGLVRLANSYRPGKGGIGMSAAQQELHSRIQTRSEAAAVWERIREILAVQEEEAELGWFIRIEPTDQLAQYVSTRLAHISDPRQVLRRELTNALSPVETGARQALRLGSHQPMDQAFQQAPRHLSSGILSASKPNAPPESDTMLAAAAFIHVPRCGQLNASLAFVHYVLEVMKVIFASGQQEDLKAFYDMATEGSQKDRSPSAWVHDVQVSE